jgi:hypothetical protein
MASRLTPNRLTALRLAAAHPQGNISPLIATDSNGRKVYLKASDETALEELGYAASMCEHGDINTSTAGRPYGDPHRGCPHLFRITDAGRQAVTDAG